MTGPASGTSDQHGSAGNVAGRRRSPLRSGIAAGGLALCVIASTWPEPAAAPADPAPLAGTVPPAGSAALVPRPTGPPSRVRIPRIGVDSSLVVLGVDRSGKLAPPTDFAQAGWYGGGTAPGDVGPAVIAGHLDSVSGPAVFARVPELHPGDRVAVLRGARWVPFRVVATVRYPKDTFPTDTVYGPTPGPELRLITCGGRFDERSRHYRDNMVVFAVADRPVEFRPGSASMPTSEVEQQRSEPRRRTENYRAVPRATANA